MLFVPALVLVPISGWAADRFDRRLVLALCALAEIAAFAGLAALAGGGRGALGATLAVVLVTGIARAVAFPASHALLPSLVEPERFLHVQARVSAVGEIVTIAGPAAGGALVAIAPRLAYGAAIALTVAFAALLAGLAPRVTRGDDAAPPRLGEAFDGLRFLRARPVLLGAIALDLVAVFFGGATALLPVYAATVFRVDAFGYGVLRSAVALGAGVCALVLARRPPARRVGRTFLVAVAAFGIATIVFGLARSLWVALPALAAIGASDMVSVVIRSGLVALGTPDAMRGRVNAVQGVFIIASNELGEFESGVLASLIGAVPAVVAGGVAVLVAVALFARAVPPLRRVDVLPSAP